MYAQVTTLSTSDYTSCSIDGFGWVITHESEGKGFLRCAGHRQYDILTFCTHEHWYKTWAKFEI